MELKRLSLSDRKVFEQFLGLREHELSVYSFANIYIWRSLFDIGWQNIEGDLCVFFRDSTGCFLYLPPLGEKISSSSIEESFRYMDAVNKNHAVSRVENLEEKDCPALEKSGYRVSPKPPEYLCSRELLEGLKGDSFKSKRASVNYFNKHYRSRYLEFRPSMSRECLELYKLWSGQRASVNSDRVYCGMLKDCAAVLEGALADFDKLGILARIVEVDGRIRGFTAGFEINRETFCVLYEFTDLSAKGLSQHIFRSFCREMKRYKYINIMDDSGLDNLKAVKDSYRPSRMVRAFIADRRNG